MPSGSVTPVDTNPTKLSPPLLRSCNLICLLRVWSTQQVTGVVHNCRVGEGRVDDCARHRIVIPVIFQTGGSSVRVLEILFVVSCIHVFRSLSWSAQASALWHPFALCACAAKSKRRRTRTHASTHIRTSDARDDEIRSLLGFVREAQAPRFSKRQLHLNRSAVVATDATNMHAWWHAGRPQTCEKWCRSCRSRMVSNILLRAGITLFRTGPAWNVACVLPDLAPKTQRNYGAYLCFLGQSKKNLSLVSDSHD